MTLRNSNVPWTAIGKAVGLNPKTAETRSEMGTGLSVWPVSKHAHRRQPSKADARTLWLSGRSSAQQVTRRGRAHAHTRVSPAARAVGAAHTLQPTLESIRRCDGGLCIRARARVCVCMSNWVCACACACAFDYVHMRLIDCAGAGSHGAGYTNVNFLDII